MAFNELDLYLTSGNTGLSNTWADTVSKFTPTSFYNWEQDNEPLHDLDERTRILWERAGHPTQDGASSVLGSVYVVSADANFVGNSSGIIFKDLQTVFDSLPSLVTHPIIIEIASLGDLGSVCLKNIKVAKGCDGAGIEIINRAFARDYNTSTVRYIEPNTIQSENLIDELLETKSTILNKTIFTGTGDTNFTNSRGWISRQPFGRSGYNTPDVLLNRSVTANTITSNELSFGTSYTVVRDEKTFIGGTSATRPVLSNGDYCNAAVYFNRFDSFYIENCTGPIYIRNICIDGFATNPIPVGIKIENCTDLVLENVTVMGSKNYGIDANNSNFKIRRSLVCARNYEGANRVTDSEDNAGLRAKNCTISVDLESTTNGPSLYGVNSPFIFAHQAIGLELINSTFEGGEFAGVSGVASAISLSSSPTIIQCMFNTVNGLKLVNSNFNHKGILEVVNNKVGINSINSNIELPMIVCEYNNVAGIVATGSNIRINPNLQKYNSAGDYGGGTENYSQWFFNKNSQHIKLANSTWGIKEASGIVASSTGKCVFLSSFGNDNFSSQQSQLPGISVQRNSTIQLPHVYMKTINGANFKNGNPVLGACISVTDNSKALVQASKYGSNQFIGAPTFNDNVALIYCNNNSIFEANGNTLICQGAIDCFADNNSKISFNPHKNDNGTLNIVNWELSSTDSHSRVELHAYRSCVVVDNGSIFNAENLGDYRAYWPASATSTVDAPNSSLYQTYASGGYLQFYPNPQDSNACINTFLNPVSGAQYADYASGHKYFLVSPTDATAIAAISNGGVCIRAMNGSKINVFNTNLPAGYANTKGIYYDVSSTECEKLRIWNIGPGSYLNATYLSLSGQYPTDVTSYFGPSAYWYTSAGAIVSGFPDNGVFGGETTRYSRLDSYGSGTGYAAGFAGIAGNFGAYRLYFAPLGSAKYLVTSSASGTDIGVPYQVISQGYVPSTVCYFSDTTEYFATPIAGLYSSGLSFVADPYKFIEDGYADRVKLDWSAAHTFANALHNAFTGPLPGVFEEDDPTEAASLPYPRRKKLVSIISTQTTAGSESYQSAAGKGKGFLSADTFDIRRNN
jgi:hypothetical protein